MPAKKTGWDAVLEAPQRPVTSPLLHQAHTAIDRKLCAMPGCPHPGGRQQACLTGLAHRYHLVPYQRRAQHVGQGGVDVDGGQVPTRDWFLNRHILTSGGLRCVVRSSTTKSDGMCTFLLRCSWKALEDTHIKLASVGAALFGVSGRQMLAALIAGERDLSVPKT